jgi:signal transduction histidine kinase
MNSNGINISEWVGSLDVRKPFYLAIINKQGFLTFTNSRFYTQFLSTREPSGHNSFFDLVPQSDQAHFKDTLAACSLQEDPITTNIRVNSGLSRWVKWEVSCITRPGQPEKFLCMGYDIADEGQIKRTDEILGLNYQTIVEDMNVGILLQDAEGKIITANQKAAEIFNTTLEELYTGKDLPLLFKAGADDPSVLPFPETPFKKTLRTGEAQTNVVINIPLLRNRYRTLLGNWQPLFENLQSTPYSVVSTFQDISREKGFEREAREVEMQLAEHKLKEQKGIAEAIIKAQEQERTRIGHELHDNINQILASGHLYLNVLNKDMDDFQEIKDKTMEILQLAIEEVRILSKAMVLPDLKKGGLVASIEDLVSDLRFGDLFDVEFTHSEVSVLEEMGQSKKVTLFRIIQEQTKNIIKYSKAKNVKIALNTDVDQTRLEINDDGVGFDQENTRRGLGLANIFERTRLYDGNAILGTSPGKGCCITVNIPFGCPNPITI